MSPAVRVLLARMSDAPRGPKRDALFALWVTVQVAEDLTLDPPQPERAFRRRVGLLRRRLSSLTLPAPLRRALNGAVGSLERATRADASTILSLLVAPARDTVGPEVAEALAKSARAAR